MTFTKEQLIARARFLIKRYEDSLANYQDQDGVAMDLELARMALSGMEAEPVAEVYQPPNIGICAALGVSIRMLKPLIDGDKLYSAPQPLTTSERAELENFRNAQQVVQHERAAFESFMEKRLGDVVDRSRALNGDNEYMACDMAVGWIAWQGRAAMQSVAVKDGWVMVPVEPTAEMISAGIAAHYERTKIQIHDRPAPGPIECTYVAMVAAAPQQEAE